MNQTARSIPHLATRIFDTPLLIAPSKFEVIVAILAPRLGLLADPATQEQGQAAASATYQRRSYEVTADGIAVIPVQGTLVHKAYGLDAMSGLRTYQDIEQEMLDAATDPEIKGILLDVDSPGGEVAGVFDLADTIYAARSTKPVFAVANNDAFSAAYLLASAADRVFVSRTSGVGSIGVIAGHLDVSGADEKAGYKYTVVHAGARKADFNPHRPLSDEARAVLEAKVNRTYELLVQTVARNRGVSEAAIRETEAGLYFGDEATRAGLADQVGTRHNALHDLRQVITNQGTKIQPGGEASMSTEQSRTGQERTEQAPPAQEATEQNQPPKPAAVETAELKTAAADQTKDALTEARKAGYEEACEIVELCGLSGFPAEATALLARHATSAEARQHLLGVRAKSAGPEIHSHVMPETGTTASQADLNNNPVVKAVERLAAIK